MIGRTTVIYASRLLELLMPALSRFHEGLQRQLQCLRFQAMRVVNLFLNLKILTSRRPEATPTYFRREPAFI